MPDQTPTPVEPLARTLLGVPAGHGAPHHDAGRIKPGDFVAQVDKSGSTRAGIAHRQSSDGDWFAEDSTCITWATLRADRPDALTIWPAPTPPAVEVEMPSEPGSVLTDVYALDGSDHAKVAVLARDGRWYGDWAGGAGIQAVALDEGTLPDGTRARRDGEHEDGTPRFVKKSA